MESIYKHEKLQIKKFEESIIYQELMRVAIERVFQCKIIVGDMLPEYLKHAKLQNARILTIEIHIEDKPLIDYDGGIYQAFTDLSYITKKGKVKLFDWEQDEEFLSDLKELILLIKNGNYHTDNFS